MKITKARAEKLTKEYVRQFLDSAGIFRILTTDDIVEVFTDHRGHNFWVLSLLSDEVYKVPYNDVDHDHELTPLEVLAWAAVAP